MQASDHSFVTRRARIGSPHTRTDRTTAAVNAQEIATDNKQRRQYRKSFWSAGSIDRKLEKAGWMAGTLYGSLMGGAAKKDEGHEVQFWENPERVGWLMKQGEYLRTWRRRWFVLKEGKIFWFKECVLNRNSKPRGVILVGNCLTVKGAEDTLNRPYAFELSTSKETMYFIADTDKEKEDWINSIGRSIVRHSKSVTEDEVLDYDSKSVSK